MRLVGYGTLPGCEPSPVVTLACFGVPLPCPVHFARRVGLGCHRSSGTALGGVLALKPEVCLLDQRGALDAQACKELRR